MAPSADPGNTGGPARARRACSSRWVAVALSLAASAGVPSAVAERPTSRDREIASCISDASVGRPWLERTLWGLRDQEAGWIGAEILNTNGSADLGPLQINSSWIPRIALLIHRSESEVRTWLIHDTCFNVRTGRWIFLTALAVTNDYWRAVGLYHSPTAWRQRRYALAVATKLTKRFGPDAFAAPRSIRNGD